MAEASVSTASLASVATLQRTLPWSSRYAPTPRLIFSPWLSALNASVIPGRLLIQAVQLHTAERSYLELPVERSHK